MVRRLSAPLSFSSFTVRPDTYPLLLTCSHLDHMRLVHHEGCKPHTCSSYDFEPLASVCLDHMRLPHAPRLPHACTLCGYKNSNEESEICFNGIDSNKRKAMLHHVSFHDKA